MPEVLALDESERRAVDEYVDDSIEPLRGIMERWKAALAAKGRVPFRAQSLPPNADGLILAAAHGALPFVRAVLASGVPVDATNDVRYTALMAAARSARVDVLKFLLAHGADVHRRDAYDHTPLHCATGAPSNRPELQRECVRLLLEAGAEIDARKQGGSTPLMSAAWFGGRASVEFLLEKGASIATRDERGRTAEDLARERGHADLAALLAARAKR